MSKISDELREFIDEGDLYPRYIAELRRIADRIDADMVELPKDVDGQRRRTSMSKISDELRNWCDDPYMGRVDDLYSLADRVDAEMVELPISADGKIWTGREECFWIEARGGAWSRHSLLSLDIIDGSRWYVRDTGGIEYEAGGGLVRAPRQLRAHRRRAGGVVRRRRRGRGRGREAARPRNAHSQAGASTRSWRSGGALNTACAGVTRSRGSPTCVG